MALQPTQMGARVYLAGIGGFAKASGYLGKMAMNSKMFGTASKYVGNSSIANKLGAGAQGIWNNKNSLIRTGWSVHKTEKYVYPVLRTSIGHGRKALHFNWVYGRFY